MPKDPPPSPPRSDPKALLAYAFFAVAIWGLVAYSLWGPKPSYPVWSLAVADRACAARPD